MAKPADFFVGITDLFSIILPGAVMTFVLLCIVKTNYAVTFDKLPLEGVGGYAAFLVAAYLLGHVIDLIGASVIDNLYDLIYANWKRSEPISLRQWLKATPNRLWIEVRHGYRSIFHKREDNPRLENKLLVVAREVAGKDRPPGVNVYKWARSWTMLKSGAASTEIERLQANSKFFRGMVTVSAITGICFFTLQAPHAKAWGWACIALAVACFFRFSDLRWKAVEQTYVFFIALRLIKEELPKTAAPTEIDEDEFKAGESRKSD